jgi:N-acylethanolamine-hydrolysing acid amidase
MAYALEIDTPYIMFMQYVYEFSAFCTSSVVRMKNGTIVHDRNLDFAFSPVMRNITYIGRFMDGDKYLFDGVMFGGYNGVMTGMRKGQFSISINERKPSWRSDPLELIKNFASLFAGYQQNTKLIRDTLTTCSSYDCAFKHLS